MKFLKRKMADRKLDPGKIDTIIGASTELKGDVFFKGAIRIDGHIQGNVSGADGVVIIGKNAVIEGDITAATVTVGGKVTGNIKGDDLEMLSSAEIRGDLKYAQLSIEEGAIFQGNCMTVNGTNDTNDKEELIWKEKPPGQNQASST